MSLGSGEVTASVTGSVTTSAPSLPTGATQVFADGNANASTATIHTVTAGKTLYIQALTLTASFNYASLAGARGYIEVDNGTGTYKQIAIVNVGIVANGHNSQSIALGFPVPIEVAAGDIVRITSTTAGLYALGTITGWEL